MRMRRVKQAILSLLFAILVFAPTHILAQTPDDPPIPGYSKAGNLIFDDAPCRRANGAACEALARSTDVDGGGLESPEIARELYRDACRLGRGRACARLAVLLADGDAAGAMGVAAGGCRRLSSPASCELQAFMLARTGNSADRSAALALSRRTCERSRHYACAQYGRHLAAGDGIPRNWRRAFAILKTACRNRSRDACDAVSGIALENPVGTRAVEARRWLLESCTTGFVDACEAAGHIALDSRAGPPDFAAAGNALASVCGSNYETCELAADLRDKEQLEVKCNDNPKDASSCRDLANLYADSTLAIHDTMKAASLFEIACRRDAIYSCEEGAEFLQKEMSGSSSAEILALLRTMSVRACSPFAPAKCELAAGLVDRAAGGPRDPVEIQGLLMTACSGGRRSACEAVDDLRISDPALEIPPVDSAYQPDPSRVEFDHERSDKPKPANCLTHVEFRGKIYAAKPPTRCSQVVRGVEVPQGGAPWQALIERPAKVEGYEFSGTDRVLCGGSLVATGWILTAAHCLVDKLETSEGKQLAFDIKKEKYTVRLGANDMTKAEGLQYDILDVVPYAAYFAKDNRAFAYDIALVKVDYLHPTVLGKPGKIRTIRLDPANVSERPIIEGTGAYVTGWGWTEAVDGRASSTLKIAKLELRSAEACTQQTMFTDARKDSVLCAAGKYGAQACHGDSGGPLVSYDGTLETARVIYQVEEGKTVPTVIGVVSRGGCGANGLPSRYTRVAKFSDWIRSVINPQSQP